VKKWGKELPKQDGAVEIKKVEEVAKEALVLPQGFEWTEIDMNNDLEAEQVFTLLREHYVEDNEGLFRFDYPVEFLRWTLCQPNFKKDWHIGVRATGKKNILAFISGTPVKTSVKGKVIEMAEINFLCVHKKLRAKKLAPILIKEITRRVNLTNVWQAIYTSGSVFPMPFSAAPYFHRSLNPKKNVETGFSSLPQGEPLARYCKRMKIHGPEDINVRGTPRLMQSKDIPQVFALYKKQTERFDVFFKMN
jgi:glycylpeptide N-tetradecanoyltransferase